jgi:hypothetical protein
MKNKTTKKRNKIKANAEKIKTSFDAGRLTNYSGILPIYKFMTRIGIPKLLETISIRSYHNTQHRTSNILSAIILGLISGLNRIKKIETFSKDPLIREILGIDEKIDEDTISNRCKRFGMKQTNEYMDIIGKISKKVHKQLGTEGDILDLDSTPRIVYGNQEGASKGFNHQKRGAKGYHPLMAFLESTRECILSWLRPGDAYTSNNTPEFLKQVFEMLSKSVKNLIVRADRGFFDDKIISQIETRAHTGYIIKVNLKNLNSLLLSQQWEAIIGMPGWEMADFQHKCAGWKRARKFVAIRRLIKETREGQLFPKKEYETFCYVTNINDSPIYLHKLYGDRGTSENWIEAVKNQMYGGSLLTNDFWANEALWLSSIMAYNISVWLRKLTDKKSWHEEPATFRSWFVSLAGKVVRSGRRIYLKMYEAYYFKEKWRHIEDGINNLQFA